MKPTDFIKEDFVTDAHEAHQDHEVQMARSDCYNAAKYAIELHKLLKNISEQQGLDGWVSEKITLANDYLRTVHEYLTYEQHSQAMPGFNPEVAEMQIESVIKEGGYEHGFADPNAPKLGGRRQDDEYVNGNPVNNIAVAINGKTWKVFAGQGPDGSKAFFQQKQKIDDMCKRKTAETGKKWSWGVTGEASTNEGQLELNTPDPVVTVQDAKGNILDTVNLSVAAQKYSLGNQQNIKTQLAHQSYTKIGNYTIAGAMGGQPQDQTTTGQKNTFATNENAGGMGAASVGTAMAGNGFANGGPGTISRPKLKKAKK